VTQVRVLEDKVAVVTGAARGIGRAYALRLARLGASIVIGDINFDSAKELGVERPNIVEEVSAVGVACEGVVCDVTDPQSAQNLIDRGISRFGRLDIVVCNVGSSGKSDSYASSASVDEFAAAIAVNLYGIVFVCQAAVPHLKEHGWGKVVMVSSTAGVRSALGGWHAPYGTAKAGVLGYMIHLAEELGTFNITVNAIAPGYIRHDRSEASHAQSDSSAAYWKQVADSSCMRRWGTIEDCAGVIEFLCTPLSDFVTGQVIFADGGLTVRDGTDSPWPDWG
jgi:3-oxoacyl-[acyl-carrier protein] reductase